MENLLKEEQDTVLESLSQVLPGSFQETLSISEDLEEVRNEGKPFEIDDEKGGKIASVDRKSVPRKRKKNMCPFTKVKRKRGRPRKNPPRVKKSAAGTEENDSGFGASGEVLKKATPECPNVKGPQHSDSEDSVTSLESVSLLQINGCTMLESNDDASDGVNLAWNVKVFPSLDDNDVEMETKPTTDKSVQTVHHAAPQLDGNIMRNVNFIGSVIRLKQMFSTHANISRKDFEKILRRLPETEESESPVPSGESSDDSDEIEVAGEDGMSFVAVKRRRRRRTEEVVYSETVRYVMRKTNAEEVTERSVGFILAWLKEETEKDWRTVCCYWDGSVGAEAVDVINNAVDCGVVGIRKKASDFLADIFNGIHDARVEDAITEFKVAFLSNFCKSILLQYDLTQHVVKKLSAVASSGSGDKQDVINATKKTYFSLRLLQDLFRSLLTGLNANGFEEIFRARPKDADAGVLNMWKKNWFKDDVVVGDEGFLEKHLKVVRGWCNCTDEVLNFSVKECPILSLVAQECSSLAREILNRVQTVSGEKI